LRLFSFGGYGLALAALALVVFGAYDSYPIQKLSNQKPLKKLRIQVAPTSHLKVRNKPHPLGTSSCACQQSDTATINKLYSVHLTTSSNVAFTAGHLSNKSTRKVGRDKYHFCHETETYL